MENLQTVIGITGIVLIIGTIVYKTVQSIVQVKLIHENKI